MRELMDEVARGALIALNLSAGKDSDAMFFRLLSLGIPKTQMVVIHADLGHVEWPGALAHVQRRAQEAGLPLLIAKANKTLLGMVRHRFATRPDVPSWPSSATRQCTSDLKRGPCEREIRRYASAHGFTRVVNCMGFRAEESSARKKRPVWSKNESQSNSKREWFNCLPIHDMRVDEVFSTIKAAGAEPHPAYALGNERLSCVFCIMGSANDIQNGFKHNPALGREYIELEELTGYTFHQSRRSLKEILALPAQEKVAAGGCPQMDLFSQAA